MQSTWDSPGLGELDRKNLYVEERTYTEETSVDTELEVDGIDEEGEHCWLQWLHLGRARSSKNAE